MCISSANCTQRRVVCKQASIRVTLKHRKVGGSRSCSHRRMATQQIVVWRHQSGRQRKIRHQRRTPRSTREKRCISLFFFFRMIEEKKNQKSQTFQIWSSIKSKRRNHNKLSKIAQTNVPKIILEHFFSMSIRIRRQERSKTTKHIGMKNQRDVVSINLQPFENISTQKKETRQKKP
jgi:hypothetical protein